MAWRVPTIAIVHSRSGAVELALHVQHRRRFGQLLQERGIIGIVPDQDAGLGFINPLQLSIEIERLARRDQAFDRAPIQPGLFQIEQGRVPGLIEIAEVIDQRADFGRADAVHPIEADPVTQVVHDLPPSRARLYRRMIEVVKHSGRRS